MLGFFLFVAMSVQTQTASIDGQIVAPAGVRVSGQVDVILFPQPYARMWDAEAQRRVDRYWEEYRSGVFIRQKEMFITASRMAHREATEAVLADMNHDGRIRIQDFRRSGAADSVFRFTNLPKGEYKIVALSRSNPELIFEAWVDLPEAASKTVGLKLFP